MHTRFALLLHAVILNACARAYGAFTFEWTRPTECGVMNVTWSGGLPPYTLVIVPAQQTLISYDLPSYTWAAGAWSFRLTQPRGTKMILTMSDWGGFGSGGVSDIMVVDPPIGNDFCDTLNEPTFTYKIKQPLQQCGPFSIQYVDAILPVTFRAFVHGGAIIGLQSNTTTLNWPVVNVPALDSVIWALTDSSGQPGPVSEIETVGDSSDSSCLQANSPSSTTSASLSATTTSSAPNSTSPSSSPSSSAPASSSSGLSRDSLVGVVVGPVVGGSIILVAVLSLLRFRRKKSLDGEIVDLADDPAAPTPGIYEPGPYSPRGSTSYQPTTVTSQTKPGVSELDAASSSQAAAAPVAGPSLMRELSITSASIPTTYIVHTDAEDARRNVVELPPQYDERRSSGLLDVPSSAPADGASPSDLITPSEKDVSISFPPHEPIL